MLRSYRATASMIKRSGRVSLCRTKGGYSTASLMTQPSIPGDTPRRHRRRAETVEESLGPRRRRPLAWSRIRRALVDDAAEPVPTCPVRSPRGSAVCPGIPGGLADEAHESVRGCSGACPFRVALLCPDDAGPRLRRGASQATPHSPKPSSVSPSGPRSPPRPEAPPPFLAVGSRLWAGARSKSCATFASPS